MAFTDRNAPNDTAIQREGLDENIEVAKPGRFYPEEFSTQIQLLQSRRGLLGEIPKTLSHIVESYDDYKISSWSDEEHTKIADEHLAAKDRIQNRETLLNEAANLEVYDKKKELQSRLIEGAEQADREGKDRTKVLSEILADYQDPEEFEGRSALQTKWNAEYSAESLQTLGKAQAYDIEMLHTKTKAAMQDAASTMYGMVLSGKLDPIEAYKKFLPDFIKLGASLPAETRDQFISDAYNQAIIAKVQQVEDALMSGEDSKMTPEVARNILKYIHQNYTQKEFTLVDENGEEHKITATLTPQTQNQLYKTWKAPGGTSGGGTGIDRDFLKDLKDVFGYDEYEKTGFSTRFLTMPKKQRDAEFQRLGNELNNSKLSPAKKQEYAEGMLYIRDQMNTMSNTVDMLSNPNFDVNTLVQLRNSLDANLQKIGETGDWSKYTFNFKLKDGTLIPLQENADIGSLSNHLGDANHTSYLYYKALSENLHKAVDLISSGNKGELLKHIDNHAANGADYMVSAMSRDMILSGKGNETSILSGKDANGAYKGASYIAASISQTDAASQKKGWGYTPIATSTISEMIGKVKEGGGFDTQLDKHLAMRAMVKGFSSAGHLSDLIDYANNKGSESDAMDIFTAISLETEGADKGYASDITNFLRSANEQTMKSAKATAKGYFKDYENIVANIKKDCNLPATEANYYDNLIELSALVSANKGESRQDFIKRAEQLINTNYITLKQPNASKTSFKVNINSPIVRGYNNSQGQYKLQENMNLFFAHLQSIGVDTNNLSYYQDAENNVFRIVEKVKDSNGRITYQTPKNLSGGNMGIFDIPANYNKSQADRKALAMAQLYKTQTLLKDAYKRKQFAEASVPITKAEQAASNPGLRAKIGRTINQGEGTRKYNEYYTDTQIINKLVAFEKALSDPVTVEKIVNNKTKSKAYIQSPSTSSNIQLGVTMRHLNNYNINDYRTPDKRGLLLDDTRKPIDTQHMRGLLENEAQILGGIATGGAANITEDANEILNDFASASNSALVVDTSEVSVPVSMAAIGEESYFDYYTVADAAGFEPTSVDMTGVVMSNYPGIPDNSEEGTPTGGAASIKDYLTGSTTEAPNTPNRRFTQAEIHEMVGYFADMWGIPQNLAYAVVRQESGGQQYVTSHAGAQGIMQLMPGTAKGLGVTDPTNAAQNIWGGMKYLNQQYKTFGDWALTLAAYNAGPAAVSKAKGIPNIPETQNYAKNILKMAGMTDTNSYPINFDLNNAKNKIRYIDSDTGMLSVKGMNDFTYLLNNSATYKGKVQQVRTNRPELLEDKPQYKDFAKYRAMKTSDGKPLFVKGNVNGFQVALKRDNIQRGQLNEAAKDAIADDIMKHQTGSLPATSEEGIKALLDTFAYRYTEKPNLSFMDAIKQSLGVGMANITPQEYENYGIPLSAQQNPVLQARALNQEFQRATDILGSERKAIFALAGGNLRDIDGKIKSWTEIKRDKENFRKDWYIQPSENEAERDAINALVAQYNEAYVKYRGI